MSASQYQKILTVAETLLSKVDLPKETFEKYNQFKEGVLEEAFVETTAVVSQLNLEVVSIYQQFISSMTEILRVLIKPEAEPSASAQKSQSTAEITVEFVDYFNKKKKLIKEVVSEGIEEASVEGKVPLQRITDGVEEMEQAFNKMVDLLGELEDRLKVTEMESSRIKEETDKLKADAESQREIGKENEILTKEIRVLKSSKDEVGEKLKQRESELEKIKTELQTSELALSRRIEGLEQSQRQSSRTSQELERSFDRICSFFKSLVTRKSQEVFSSKNLPQILDTIEDYVDNLLKRNRQLNESLTTRERELKQQQEASFHTEKKTSHRMAEIRQLVNASSLCMADIDVHAARLDAMTQGVSHKTGIRELSHR